MEQMMNLDAEDTAFFARELEQVKSRLFDVVKAPLAANRLIPVDSTTSPGARTVVYSQFDAVGVAKIIANYADDMPMAEVTGKQFSSTLKGLGFGYSYSIEDIRAAQLAGLPLEQRRANQALRAHQEAMNRLAFFGDATHGIQGWLTNANIPASAVVNGAAASPLWSSKTPDEILRDLNSAVADIVSLSKGAEAPDTVVMPIKQYQQIAANPRSSTSDTTILQFFLGQSPHIRSVEWASELEGAFPGATDGFIVYQRSIDKMWQEVPVLFEQFPPQADNFAFKVPCHSKHGGTIVPYPLAQRFRYGI